MPEHDDGMRDVAAEADARGITIQQVGVRDLHLPVMVREKTGRLARVVGVFDASVELPKGERGTHMSRFVEVLSQWSKKSVSQFEMQEMLREIVEVFNARAARVRLSFKYFLTKTAPASGIESDLDYDCVFEGAIEDGDERFTLEVTVPVITLCPCSKEISDRGAHSQRAVVTVRVEADRGVIIWLEDLIPLIEAQGSQPVYSLLKRPDEKVVTECSYDNPKFVEDVVRDTILALRALPGVRRMSTECQSLESIHNHIAYAMAESESD